VVKKDVAPGQNFSRFNPLTKITVFRLIRNPMIGDPEGTQVEGEQAKVQSASKESGSVAFDPEFDLEWRKKL
jgi:hypothetical protein